MSELTPEERYEIGRRLGETIVSLFEVVANLDGIPLRDAVDMWVESYVAERIIQEAGDTDATE